MTNIDVVSALTHALDVVREAFDLALATTLPGGERLQARRWYLNAATRRVTHAARVVRALAEQTTDARIIAVSERLDIESRVVLARLRAQLADDAADGWVGEIVVDDATGPVPACRDAGDG